MAELAYKPQELAWICSETEVSAGLDHLRSALSSLLPELEFNWTLTRGGWHRLGGVVDADYRPISDNIAQWSERESGGDVDVLLDKYHDKGYFATHLAGKTHYFNAAIGERAEDFVQLEVEELREVLDRPLIDPGWLPDSLEEFLDPLDYPRLEPEPVAKPYYQFRRITPITELLNEARSLRASKSLNNLQRFFQDWDQSSAGECGHFSRHWILALREYTNSDGELSRTAKPVCTYPGDLPELPPVEGLSGAKLANAIHAYDRTLGCPFAWFFIMVTRKGSNYKLAEAVLRDQMGAYDYLPARDLMVLRQWEERPYGV